ncbi:MAG: hypothetical protein M5U22_04455 [Thermoleophilia bacterium]|nr:hypothetical protein [Thermoleophilia bacterium]
MNEYQSDAELRRALKNLAPPIAVEGKWGRVQARTRRARRFGGLRKTVGLVAALGVISLAAPWAYGALRPAPPIVQIEDQVVGGGVSVPSKPDVAQELALAWRDVFLEGLWAGNVDTLPERPAGLSADFWQEPENPFEVPQDLTPSWNEWKPLWVFGNELAPQQALSAFQAQGERRPVLVFEPPRELLDLLGLVIGGGEATEISPDGRSSGGAAILMRLPSEGWEVLRVEPSSSRTAGPAVSAGRETYEALARATMIELGSYAGGGLLNPDTEDDARGALDRTGRVIYRGTWGEAPGQFGAPPRRGEASGSYSMAVGPKEYLFVLDPAGGKVQVLSPEGEAGAEIPLDAQAPEDVAVSIDATVFVNDRRGTGQVQAYRIDSGLLGSVPASAGGLEVVNLVGVSTGSYGGVYAEVEGQGGSTFFASVYRFEALSPRTSREAPSSADMGQAASANQTANLRSPFDETYSRSDLAPLGQGWWGRVGTEAAGPHLSVSGPRGPYDVPLGLEEGHTLEKADVVSLVESLNGDPRDCRVMVSGVVRDSQGSLHRAVWLFDARGRMIERFLLPGESANQDARELAASGSFEGFLYVLELHEDGVHIRRYRVD